MMHWKCWSIVPLKNCTLDFGLKCYLVISGTRTNISVDTQESDPKWIIWLLSRLCCLVLS
jgi:hypothetical protein